MLRQALLGGAGFDVVGLEFEVAGEIPVDTQGEMVRTTAPYGIVVEIQRAMAQQHFYGAPRMRGHDVADIAAAIRARFASEHIADEQVVTIPPM